jgi:hypothetical protein
MPIERQDNESVLKGEEEEAKKKMTEGKVEH